MPTGVQDVRQLVASDMRHAGEAAVRDQLPVWAKAQPRRELRLKFAALCEPDEESPGLDVV